MNTHPVTTIVLGRLQQYLRSRGWRERPLREGALAHRFEREVEGTLVPITVPARSDLGDYERRVAEVIEALAVIEQREPRAIVADLERPSADLLRVRVASARTEAGATPLKLALDVRMVTWQVLLAASHSVLFRRAVHPRLSVKEAIAFADGCLEGPTERGSFVTNVIVPVTPPIATDEDESFGRRVTTLVIDALEFVRDSVENDRAEALLTPAAATAGASANLLDALASLDESGTRGVLVDTSVQWAVEHPSARATPSVRLDGRTFPKLREVAKVLRDRAPAPAGEFVGYVLGLRRERNEPDADGTAILHGTVEGMEQPIRASATLDSRTYSLAASAHEACVAVRVQGALRRRGRRWEFAAVTAFEVDDSSEP